MSTTTPQQTHATPESIDFPELHKQYADRLRASMIKLTKNREAAEDAAAAAFAKAFETRAIFQSFVQSHLREQVPGSVPGIG